MADAVADRIMGTRLSMSAHPGTENNSAMSGNDVGLSTSRAKLDRELKAVIVEVLGIDPAQAAALDGESGLFGHLPELDSMAVATLLTEMEDCLDIVIEDDDVDGEMLETYGGLLAFAEAKLAER